MTYATVSVLTDTMGGSMRILVTGGAGFIGSHIVDACVEAGHEVAVVDDLSSGKTEDLHPQTRFYQMDICDRGLEAVFQEFRPEVVNHHAAQMSVSFSVREPERDARVNVLGTIQLMECAVRYGIKKAIFSSSGGTVYGNAARYPIGETAPLQAISPYGVSKIAGEHYFRYYAAQKGIPCTVFRYANVYGPRQNPHGEAGVMAIFREKILAGARPTLFGARQTGDAGCFRDYVYVEDVVRANLLALDRSEGEVLNIGTGVETSTREVFDLIAARLGYREAPVAGEPRAGDLLRNVLDVTRAAQVLGWRPEVGLKEGVARTVPVFQGETDPWRGERAA